MFLHLEHVPLLPHFAYVTVFIFIDLVGWLCLLNLEKWLYIGDVIWGPAAHSIWSSELYVLEVAPA